MTFKFKQYTIQVEEGEGVFAYYDGEKIGSFEVFWYDDDFEQYYYANHINVDNEHRRNGVATEMVKAAVEHLSEFRLPSLIPSGEHIKESKDRFTQEGQSLFGYCLRKGFVPESYFAKEPVW